MVTGEKGWGPVAWPLVGDGISQGPSLDRGPTRASPETRATPQLTPKTAGSLEQGS